MSGKSTEEHAPACEVRLDSLREFIAESAFMARINAELVETYTSIGDDTGMEYALRRLIAYTKALTGAVCDLDDEKQRRNLG